MSRNESIIIGRIDRRRERSDAREERTARQRNLNTRAASVITCAIGELPVEDRADFVEYLAAAVRVQCVAHHGPVSAASILGREAGKASENLLTRRIAVAEAERLFAKAANDGVGQ